MPDEPVGGYPPLKVKRDTPRANSAGEDTGKAAKRYRRPDTAQFPELIVDELEGLGVSMTMLQGLLDEHGSDGCTVAPNFCVPACWLHDALWMAIDLWRIDLTYAQADRLYRRCIMAIGREDEWWWWPLYASIAWGNWAAVRVAGRWFR